MASLFSKGKDSAKLFYHNKIKNEGKNKIKKTDSTSVYCFIYWNSWSVWEKEELKWLIKEEK